MLAIAKGMSLVDKLQARSKVLWASRSDPACHPRLEMTVVITVAAAFGRSRVAQLSPFFALLNYTLYIYFVPKSWPKRTVERSTACTSAPR